MMRAVLRLCVLAGLGFSAETIAANGVALAQQAPVPGYDRTSRSEELAADAKSFVSALTSKWSDTNAVALDGLDAFYAPQVDYFGKRLSRDRVLADKRRFAERWPERTYKIQSSHEQCSGSECLVEGYVEWGTRSRTRKTRASGTANFRYVLVLTGRAFAIREEGGNVVKRRSREPRQPGLAMATSARHDAIDDEDVARDQHLQPAAEIERPARIAIEEDAQRVLADLPQRGDPTSQPESTLARETYQARNARSDVFDARLITVGAIILSFILWPAVRRELRKRKSRIGTTRTNRRTEQRAERERHDNGKRSRTFNCRNARSRWDQRGPTGPGVTNEAQRRGAKEWEGFEWPWQELREAVREGEAEHQWERKREPSTNWQSAATAWWSVLEVSPAAGKDEIVRSYRRKIQRCHPDRVCGLAPEFISLAEKHTKTLNEAYAEAMHACR
jgi:hypothetical protein